jgi:hypothetical protein
MQAPAVGRVLSELLLHGRQDPKNARASSIRRDSSPGKTLEYARLCQLVIGSGSHSS